MILMKKPILITGSHRSGTTWVGRILSNAPRVRYIHEPFNLHINRPGCPFNYPFEYLSSNTDLGHQRITLDYIKSFHRFSLSDAVNELRNCRSAHSFRTIVADSRHRITDRPLIKDPIALFSAEWLYENLNCDVIVMIRHPAAFVSSLKIINWKFDFANFIEQPELMQTHLYAYKDEIIEFTSVPQDIIKQGILLWNIIYSTIIGYQDRYKGLWNFVKHEDLSETPLPIFEMLHKKLGLNFSRKVQRAIVSSTTAKNDTDLARNSKENIKAWKNRLSSDEILSIKRGTLPIWENFYSEEDWN